MTPDDMMFYSTVLSVLPASVLKKGWELIDTSSPKDIYSILNIDGQCMVQDYISKKYSGDPLAAAEKILERCGKYSIGVVHYWSPDYPSLLREISRPPLVLYCRGDLAKGRKLAIVGTRRSDSRSEKIAKRISGELAESGFSIVSGMAIGIDRAAHFGALEAKGRTVGILANGIDIMYPSLNRDLYRMIDTSHGSSLISEYPPGIFAGKWTFIRRNRIISGISLGTVVIKAGPKSGALITARYASEQNRDVFACPGNSFDDGYAGCNLLIKNGAVLVSSTEDIIHELPLHNGGDQKIHSADTAPVKEHTASHFMNLSSDCDPLMNSILNLLTADEMEIDCIVRKINSPPGDVNRAVMMLEIYGMISRKGNFISKL